jgi:uncharacterized protein YuzE
MKLTIDKEADALYLDLDETPAVESEEISPGVILDYNSEGKVTGIEPEAKPEIGRRGDQMLYLSKRVPSSQLGKVEVEPQALLAAS